MTKSHSGKPLENVKENSKSHRYRWPSVEDSDSDSQVDVSRRSRRSRGRNKARIAMSKVIENDDCTRDFLSRQVQPLDSVSRREIVMNPREKPITITDSEERCVRNEAPITGQDRVKDIVNKDLKTPLYLTTEDLMVVSTEFRDELKNLVHKKMTANDLRNVNLSDLAITFALDDNNDSDEVSNETVKIQDLPPSSFELPETVTMVTTENMPTNSIICEDSVVQCFVGVPPGEESEEVVVSTRELQVEGQEESGLDRGTQIVAMAETIEKELRIPWDPDIKVPLQNPATGIKDPSKYSAKKSWAECLMQPQTALFGIAAMEDKLSRSLAQVAVRGAHALPMLGALFLRY